MKKKLIIFDLDGTLLYTIEDLGTAVNYALGLRNLPQHSMDEYKSFVGHGVRNLIERSLPESHRQFVDEVLCDFRTYYCQHIADHTIPYEGIPELLAELASNGCKLAVASNKFQEGTETLINNLFPDIPFVAVCGNSPDLPLKPDAALVRHIMSLCPDITADEAVMIGDSGTDINTARNGGISSIAVTWGYRPASSLSEADALVSDVEELRSLLLIND